MQRKNLTEVREFVFLGFSRFRDYQIALFVVVLALYTLTLVGNAIITIIICIDRHLHTPMCFFLSMLASSETAYTLVTTPRLLSGLLAQNQPISTAGCTALMMFFVALATTASCSQQWARTATWYTDLMSKRVCVQLMCGASGIGLAMAVVQVTSIFTLPFCQSGWTFLP